MAGAQVKNFPKCGHNNFYVEGYKEVSWRELKKLANSKKIEPNTNIYIARLSRWSTAEGMWLFPESKQKQIKAKGQVEIKTTKKKCPFCAEEIQYEAIKCKHCKEWLPKDSASDSKSNTSPPRIACADGNCTGALGLDGICGTCGKRPEEVKAQKVETEVDKNISINKVAQKNKFKNYLFLVVLLIVLWAVAYI